MFELRPYQIEAIEAIWQNLDKHCVASLPTGSGKTPIIAELIRRFLEWPDTHILCLTHKRELIRQNMEALEAHLPFTTDLGVYCAGLRSKQLRQVTIASVQSLVNSEDMPPFEIIIVDEAHLVPHKTEGQYHALFARLPEARILGLTATPFRLQGGMLHKGEHKLFDALVYEAKTGDLIAQGYLSPVRSKAVSEHADLSEVHIRAGEYKPDEMILAMDKEKITQAAVKDVLARAANRTSILVFCSGVEHARHVQQAFMAAGQTSIATITESTNMHERDEIVDRFKAKTCRILCNVGVFTTGFNAPNVDTIVLLRATKSAGLYVQMVGRGLRLTEGKTDCLLLDYGGNIENFGPLDTITSQSVTSGKGGAAPIKTCPECASIILMGLAVCPDCGYVFPERPKREPKHGFTASELDPISAKPTIISEYEVLNVTYDRHPSKHGKPDTMRVIYHRAGRLTSFQDVSEWVCPEHDGFAKQKAYQWFARRGVVPCPDTVAKALVMAEQCLWPKKITVREGGKYPEIIAVGDWQKPDPAMVPSEIAEDEDNIPF